MKHMKKFTSSTISKVAYDNVDKLLYVKFKSRRVYKYSSFGGINWSQFCEASSKGSHFNRNIKDSFAYVEIDVFPRFVDPVMFSGLFNHGALFAWC